MLRRLVAIMNFEKFRISHWQKLRQQVFKNAKWRKTLWINLMKYKISQVFVSHFFSWKKKIQKWSTNYECRLTNVSNRRISWYEFKYFWEQHIIFDSISPRRHIQTSITFFNALQMGVLFLHSSLQFRD